MQGVLNILGSSEAANSDMVLKMTCLDYIKNFYNDSYFKVDLYAPLLPLVVQATSIMLMEQSASSNVEIVNEILEVFRHIISNYAGSVQKLPDSNCTIVVHLVTLFS